MKKRTRTISNKVRGIHGQALVESAAAMILIAMLTIFATVFVLNVGVAVYYKQKLSFAACQAAQSAVDACTWNNALRPGVTPKEVEDYTEGRTKKILKALGLPAADEIKVDRTDEGVSVRIKISNLQLIKSGLLPSFISTEESGYSLFSSNEPPAFLTLRTGDPRAMEGYNQSVVIPVYGRFSLKNSAPDLRAKNAVVPEGVAALLPSRFNSHIFDVHIHPGQADFFDRTSAQARADRGRLLQ